MTIRFRLGGNLWPHPLKSAQASGQVFLKTHSSVEKKHAIEASSKIQPSRPNAKTGRLISIRDHAGYGSSMVSFWTTRIFKVKAQLAATFYWKVLWKYPYGLRIAPISYGNLRFEVMQESLPSICQPITQLPVACSCGMNWTVFLCMLRKEGTINQKHLLRLL